MDIIDISQREREFNGLRQVYDANRSAGRFLPRVSDLFSLNPLRKYNERTMHYSRNAGSEILHATVGGTLFLTTLMVPVAVSIGLTFYGIEKLLQ